MRGEFRSKSGLVLPNNLTIAGSQAILTAWAQNVVPTFWLGLVKGTPGPNLTKNDVKEPTVGTNGYARYQLNRDSTDWPDFGNIGAENFIGSKFVQWVATGAYDEVVTRVCLFNTGTIALTNPIMALSSPLPADFQIDADTDPADINFQYRLYL